MKDYIHFLANYDSLDDSDRAKMLAALHSEWSSASDRYGSAFMTRRLISNSGAGDTPMPCYVARVVAYENLLRDSLVKLPRRPECCSELDFLLSAARDHIDACEKCRQWWDRQMPHLLDMAWSPDRQVLCMLMRVALLHEQQWPNSYEVAVHHAGECLFCRAWESCITTAKSCEDTRTDLHREDWRRDERIWPTDAIDAHVANCTECQEWCRTSTTCRECQYRILIVLCQRRDEWMPWRKPRLGPLETYHLKGCEACRSWVEKCFDPDNLEYGFIYEVIRDEPESSEARLLSQLNDLFLEWFKRILDRCNEPPNPEHE